MNSEQLQTEFYNQLLSDTSIFERLQNNILDGLCYCDLQEEQCWISTPFWKMLGYQNQPSSLHTWKQVIHPDDAHLIPELFSAQINHPNDIFEHSIRYIHKNGSTVHTHCRGFILCNAKGLPNRVISVHTDITDYITRKNVLQSEKERLTYAIEGSQDGVWDWNLATNEVFYSPRWKSILGYEECEVENAFLSWEELLHPDDLAAARQYIQSYLEDTNSSFETRFRMRHKQGHYVPILSRAKKVDIVQGDTTVAHLIGTHVDLSEIMAIQDKLNHQVQLTNTYLNTTNTLLLALDKDGKVTMLNKKGCEILGVTEDSILGKSWFDLPFLPAEILCEYRTKHSYFIDEKLDLGHPIDHPLITAHNDVKMFTWSSALLRDKNAEVIGTLSSAYDITERTKVRNKLEQSEFMLKQAQKLAKIGYYTINLKNDLWSCSTEINELFGINHNHLITTELWFKCIHPEDRQEMHEYFASLIKGKKSEFDKQYRIINQTSHETLWVQGKGFLKFDENGSAIEMFGTIQDISEQLRTKKELILAANVYNNTTEGIVVTDKQGQIIDVNSAFCNITGYSKQEVLGKNPNILNSGIHPSEFYYEMWESIRNTGQWEGEIWNRKKSGETYPEYIKINTIRDANDEVQNYLALFSDISLQKGNEFKLKKMEHYDPLTALPNRVLLSDRLKQSIARANRDNTMLSLAFIDLDGFKQINDSFGTEIGDQVLKIISKRYTKQARVNDTIARIGGDEFIILLDHVETLEESLSFYDRFLEISRQPIELEGHSFNISCSIGISYYPQELPVDSDHLIRQADNAMYQAKLSGKNSYHIFDNEQDQIARERHQKLIEINQAILNDELLLHYQPKVDMRSRKTIGFEALVRWQHPTKGLLPPIAFLPYIEKNTTSIALDKWVIEHVFQQASQWLQEGIKYPISINLGAEILQNYDLMGFIEEMFQKYPKVTYEAIELEVLETSALEDMKHAYALMHTSEKLGIKFAIDDFGTGYSSLEYLKNLPASYLKIDQSFVRDMLEDKGDLAILNAVIGLAKAFGMQTIAEGVESERHCKQLIKLGCFIAQGYGIAKPMPPQTVKEWLKN